MKRGSLSIFFAIFLLASCATLNKKGPSPASAVPADFSSRVLALPLACVDQELPHAYEGQGEGKHAAKKMHPAFFGCYDWHSSAHSHWAMMRLLGQDPSLKENRAITEKLNRHLTAKNIRRELAYFKRIPNFEFPYGQGWLLRLAQEALRSPLPGAKAWSAALEPLAKFASARFQEFLPLQRDPIRAGTHDNTAFALTHVWDYAVAAGNQSLLNLVRERAGAYYGSDKSCPIASEPGSFDFISPCMAEADLMRRVLSAEEFKIWFAGFLPEIPAAYLGPRLPENPKDYSESHLIGLLYQKAFSMRAVALQLPELDPRRAQLLGAIPAHLNAAWNLMFESGYGGTHWLASFAIYFYTNAGLEELK